MPEVQTLRYSDLGTDKSQGLSGEIEVILTCRQASLLKRFNATSIDPKPSFLSSLTYLLFHLRMLLTYPRLFWLGEYYDPETLELAGFEPLGKDHVRLTFKVLSK